jgi:hypothetical protein
MQFLEVNRGSLGASSTSGIAWSVPGIDVKDIWSLTQR